MCIRDRFCALREDRPADRIICRIGTVSANVPFFFLALLLILVFSVNLGILPSGGAYDLGKSGDWLNRAVHLILPVSVLVLQHLWYYAYMVRNKLVEETRKDYVPVSYTHLACGLFLQTFGQAEI